MYISDQKQLEISGTDEKSGLNVNSGRPSGTVQTTGFVGRYGSMNAPVEWLTIF